MRFPKLTIAAVATAASVIAVPAAHAQAPAPAAAATGGASFDTPDAGLIVEPGALRGDTLSVAGTLVAAAGDAVRIERLDGVTGAWLPVAHAQADQDGRFEAQWTTDTLGPATLRAVPDRGDAAQASASSVPVSATTTVYRPARATWYGPGFWGRRTACGVRLTRTTIGIAHKRLPCGTRVTVYLGGQQLTVPVIDRGPFGGGASWDLTEAAAERLGMTETSRIGWLRAQG